MKSKIINIIIVTLLTIFAAYLRGKYGLYNTVLLMFPACILGMFLGCYFSVGGSIKGYIKNISSNLSLFINEQARNYHDIPWYKKPKYWILAILLALIVLNAYDVAAMFMFSLVIVSLIPFVARGYSFVFILLSLASICTIGIVITRQHLPLYAIIAFCVWFISFSCLALVCARIETKRNALTHPKRPVLRDILLSVGAFFAIFCAFVANEFRIDRIKHDIAYNDCLQHFVGDLEVSKHNVFCECMAGDIPGVYGISNRTKHCLESLSVNADTK